MTQPSAHRLDQLDRLFVELSTRIRFCVRELHNVLEDTADSVYFEDAEEELRYYSSRVIRLDRLRQRLAPRVAGLWSVESPQSLSEAA